MDEDYYAQQLRGGQQPAPAPAQPDRQALINALRRHADLGMLMNVGPTAAVGAGLNQRASGYEQDAYRQAALQNQQAQYQAQAERYAADRAMRERDMQLRAWKAQQDVNARNRQLDQGESEYGAIADPITGESRMFNKRTGEWKPSAATEPKQEAPQETPQKFGFVGMPPTVKLSEVQNKNMFAASTMANAVPMIESVIASGWKPGNNIDKYASHLPLGGREGIAQALVPSTWSSDAGSKFYNAGQLVLASILRPESGGAITADEWIHYGPMYLPWPGDPQDLIQHKVAMLRERMNLTAAGAGPASRFFVPPPLPVVGGEEKGESGEKKQDDEGIIDVPY